MNRELAEFGADLDYAAEIVGNSKIIEMMKGSCGVKRMKIALIDDKGNVIDTYEDVCLEDLTSNHWQGIIWEWLGRTARQYAKRQTKEIECVSCGHKTPFETADFLMGPSNPWCPSCASKHDSC